MKHKKLFVVVAIIILAIPSIYVASNNHKSEAQEQEIPSRDNANERLHEIIANFSTEGFTTEQLLTMSGVSDEYPPNDEWTEFPLPADVPLDDPLMTPIQIPVMDGMWKQVLDFLVVSAYEHIEGSRSMGGARKGGNWIPLFLVFDFSDIFDASQYESFRFWGKLRGQCEDWIAWGLIDTNSKCADIMWDLGLDNWQWKEADMKGLTGDWAIDAGFDWTSIDYMFFSCDAISGDYYQWSYMYVDNPMFYRVGVPIPHGRIDDVIAYSESLKLVAELWHDAVGDNSPYWDYYVVSIGLQDTEYVTSKDTHPSFATLELQMQEWCQEFPIAHEPIAKSYGSSPLSYGFSIYGFGFSISPPAYNVKWDSSTVNGKRIVRWDMDTACGETDAMGWIFKDYVSFAFAFRVPEGRKPFIYVGTQVRWYKQLIPISYIIDHFEEIYWVSVDPVGAGAFSPEDPEPLITRETYGNAGFPVAKFSFSPELPFIGQSVTFNASESYDTDETGINTYQWNWGDGSWVEVKTEPIAYHAFNAGWYKVKLTVNDNEAGKYDFIEKWICP